MFFDDLFRKNRLNKLLQVTSSRLSAGDGPEAWGFAAATGVLWGISHFFWRCL